MSNKIPKWKLVEHVVKLIEQSLSPESRVEHNVWLPDLTESSNKRQCDIVIWSGSPPRETISIVEVQDRSKPFDITTFDGLCTKMRKVGAQHLICVSRQRFPKSIIDGAKKYGPTVRLVLLEEIEKGNWPIFIIENSIQALQRISHDVASIRLEINREHSLPSEQGKNNINDKVFRLNNSPELLSLNDLISVYLDKHEQYLTHNKVHTIKMHFPEDDQHLSWIQYENEMSITSLDFEVEVEIKKKAFPLKCLGYRQAGDGTLAWIMDATLLVNDVEHNIQITIVPSGNGEFKLKLWNLPSSMTPDFITVKTE